MTTLQIDTEPTWRGGEQQVMYLAHGLRAAGQRPIIVAQPGSPLLKAAQEAAIEVRPLRMRGEIDLNAALRIAALARREEASILHAHTSRAHTLALLACRLGCRARVIVARRVDFPVRGRWKYGKAVDRFIAVSDAVKAVLERCGVGTGRIAVVPDGVDVSRIDAAAPVDCHKEFGLDPSHVIVGNVAHMADHKGQRYLIDAVPQVLATHPEARFIVVGSGELWDALTSQAKRLGVERQVIFPGFRSDVPGLLKSFDLFVMASHLEGLCSSLLDAMAARLPVVATTAGGIPELIEHEQNGLLVPPKDPAALAAAITRLIENRALAARLAAEGRRTVEERFSAKRMVEATLAIYQAVLGVDAAEEQR